MNLENNKGRDLVGLGEVAKAIPPEVYIQSTQALVRIFSDLVAPITESTSGFGRYIRQKFDNMVEVEKSLATYTLKNAIQKAEKRAQQSDSKLISPTHPKSFVKAIEEASKETDPLLHEMWENLISDQLIDPHAHPHFVEILPHFSPSEARLLSSLFPKVEISDKTSEYLAFNDDDFKNWVRNIGEPKEEWSYSCILLCEFRFANVIAPNKGIYPENDVTVLYRTAAGNMFISAVSSPSMHNKTTNNTPSVQSV